MATKGKPDGREQLARSMAQRVVNARETAKRVKRPGGARPLRPARPLAERGQKPMDTPIANMVPSAPRGAGGPGLKRPVASASPARPVAATQRPTFRKGRS